MNILIVDDDDANVLLLKKLLEPFGRCDTASTGNEAMELFKLKQRQDDFYKLILLDIMMPDKNGQETLEEIRAFESKNKVPEEHRARVIMITAMSDFDTVMNAFDEKCDAYLVKPINVEKLHNELSEMGIKRPDF